MSGIMYRGLIYRGLMLGLGSGIDAWLDLEFHAMISLGWLGMVCVGLGWAFIDMTACTEQLACARTYHKWKKHTFLYLLGTGIDIYSLYSMNLCQRPLCYIMFS